MEDHSIRDRFLEFVGAMDMTLSYKPVMLLALLESIDGAGRAKLSEVVRRFQQFYRDRRGAGLAVERPGARKQPVDELDAGSAQRLMLDKPFEKFERRQFLRYDRRDLAYIQFEPRLWRQLEPGDLDQVRQTCRQAITEYYERLDKD